MYSVQFTKAAKKDAVNVVRGGFKPRVDKIIEAVEINPFEVSLGFEELVGGYKGAYSRRINRKHRFVYEVLPNTDNLLNADGEPYTGIVKVISMWTHYE